MRMQVECPICSTKLIFQVAPQWQGRTVRVTCTGCDTPIDAATELSAPVAQKLPHAGPALHERHQGNGLANSASQNVLNKGPGFGSPDSRNPPASNMQQQHPSLQVNNQNNGGTAKRPQDVLNYEVQCPHSKVIRLHSLFESSSIYRVCRVFRCLCRAQGL
jgi:hypothetical protein